jgi:multiple sugar transport system permease protein
MSLKSEQKIVKWSSFIFLTILAVVWITPMLWILSTSLKPESEAISHPITWIPKTFTFQNYEHVIMNTNESPIVRWFLNSLFIATTHTVLLLIITALAAFAYARLKFKGRDFLFWTLMSTMMIPPVMNLVPLYSLVSFFGWIDTPWAMVFPGLGAVMGIFLLRQFYIGIPVELEEAARIDGANTFQIFHKIILPLAKPALVVVGLFSFMGNWNDFLWPLIVTNSTEMRTLPAGLSILQGNYNIQYAKMMTATVLSAIPVIILFLFTQRFFVKGIALSGLKG